MERYPSSINSDIKYQETVENCKTLSAYTKLMEDKILMGSSQLTETELWSLIQKLSQDILNTHDSIKQVDVQQWIVGFHNLWQDIRKGKKNDKGHDTDEETSSDAAETTDEETTDEETTDTSNNVSIDDDSDSGYYTGSDSDSDMDTSTEPRIYFPSIMTPLHSKK